MLNERQDEFAGWAGKLEEPGALSGEGLADKDASWEKLHTRIRPTQIRTKPKRTLLWFWLSAAALLIILVGIPLIKTIHIPTTHIPTKPIPATPPSEIVRIIPNTPNAPVNLTPIHSAPILRPGIESRHKAAPPQTPDSNNLIAETDPKMPVETTTADPARATNSDPAQPTQSTTLETTASIPAKKELRIVSINEIADTLPAPSPAMAQKQYKRHPFTIGFGNNGTIRPATAAHNNSSNTNLTISLSSQNP